MANKVFLKTVELKDYRSFAELKATLSKRTIIKGKNGLGKSTILNAFLDVLTDKAVDGSKVVGFFPVGEDVDSSTRIIGLNIGDDNHIISKKTVGSSTKFEVDGEAYTQQQYKTWLKDNIGTDSENMIYCISPTAFIKLMEKSTTDARILLESMLKFNFIDTLSNEEATELEEICGVNSIEITKKNIKRNISKLSKIQEQYDSKLQLIEQLMADDEILNILEGNPSIKEATIRRLNIIKRSNEDMLKATAREWADAHRELAVLEQYDEMRLKALAKSVNKHFKGLRFDFIEHTKDGEIIESCKIKINGVPYGKGLNTGDMKLAEIELCKGFQSMCKVDMPIFIDEMEVVDPWRVPKKLKQQLIMIQRSNSSHLEIVKEKENG